VKIDWHSPEIDWTKTNMQLALKLGVSQNAVSNQRQRLGKSKAESKAVKFHPFKRSKSEDIIYGREF
jgi:hypothetical protein